MTSHHSRHVLPCSLVAGFLLAAAVASAQAPGANANQPDTPGTGRFPAMKEEVVSLPSHVVYRPKDLSALGATKLGVVAWGNGGCSDDGASTRLHLLEIASHGYLVIANGRILSGPGAPPREPRPAAQPGQIQPPRTKASDLTDAIDWALAENARRGSPFFGRIDPALVALSGWSCGGLQALQVAKDPRVKTMVLQNTGVFNSGSSAIPGMDVRKDVLTTIHTPTIYILGGPKDIAYENGHGRLRADLARAGRRGESARRARRHVFRAERRRGGLSRRELARLAASRRHAERRTVRRRELRAVPGQPVVASA
jgi:dienelactone hydrolase